MRRVATENLIPGMVIAENVYNIAGGDQLILPKGHTLDDRSITRLAFYAIINVLVEEVLLL